MIFTASDVSVQTTKTHVFGVLLFFVNYGILFLIILKDKRPKVFKLVNANSALDFLKSNTSQLAPRRVLFLRNPRHRVLTTTKSANVTFNRHLSTNPAI